MRPIAVSEAKGKMCSFMAGNCMAWVYANNTLGKIVEKSVG